MPCGSAVVIKSRPIQNSSVKLSQLKIPGIRITVVRSKAAKGIIAPIKTKLLAKPKAGHFHFPSTVVRCKDPFDPIVTKRCAAFKSFMSIRTETVPRITIVPARTADIPSCPVEIVRNSEVANKSNFTGAPMIYVTPTSPRHLAKTSVAAEMIEGRKSGKTIRLAT